MKRDQDPGISRVTKTRVWVALAAILLAVAVIAGGLVVFATDLNGQRLEAASWEYHTLQVKLAALDLRTTLDEAQANQSGYLLTGDESYLAPYRLGLQDIRSQLEQLRALTGDNPAQQARIAQLTERIGRRLQVLQATVEQYQSGAHEAAIDVVRRGDGKQAMEDARALLDQINDEESRLLASRTSEMRSVNSLTSAAIIGLAVVGGLLLLGAAIAAFIAVRGRERARAAESLRQIAEELKSARDFLQLVIDRCVEPIFVKDAKLRFVLANQSGAELFGATGSEMIGAPAREFLPAAVAQTIEAADRLVIETGEARMVEEAFVANGRRRFFQISKTPWRDRGRVAGVLAVWHDVTERKAEEDRQRQLGEKLERDVQEKVREIEAANAQVRQLQKMEAIGQLTGGIAHDFNNMLAVVIGSLDLATRKLDKEPDKARASINNAQEGARRAATLTARLLAFSRQQPLAPEPIDPNKLVAGMSELLRRTIGESVQVETVLAGGIWRAYADAGQLENALLNLCVNSRDAMPEGGRLTIETANAHLDDSYAATHAEVKAGQYLMLAVTDTGVGMAPEVIERAFDPFYTTKGPARGTGLGLSQVYGFVKQSGGHIKIYSEQGDGTTVKIYLPRYLGKDVPATVQEIGVERPVGAADEVILVVEDELAVRTMSVDALRELGYTVIHAGSGADALQKLEAHPSVNLLFTDIVMPDMNGRRLADTVLARRPTIKVLYTTGYTQNAVIHNGTLDAGVAFLPKPFSLDALARKVRQVLDGGGANRV
jgi:PAS domain S-box-containing protein